MSKYKFKLLIFDLFFLVLLVATDQFTKYIAVLKLKSQPAFSIIDGVLEFNYLENRGAAFGMLQNQKFFFIVVASAFLCVIAYVLFKSPDEKKYTKLHVLLVMIASGAIGNMIDRLRFDYVVDFIYIVLINFPIFNVADMYVTFSTAIMIFQVFFVYQENDFDFLKLGK
ncbi:signal peptidase II [Parablautia muri]|uniref:Lipoprotein signal peptidase n=1 Tax=Parablautia muri TaxID=2320879 RepID=A0A9X5GQT7_9FIRM|nr:signal peptidase II [Parablautia muri]